ncbi:MAG: glycine zipper 2TM domain-containing protein [Janthinobacterium lividum]
MKSIKHLGALAVVVTLAAGLAGCDSMTSRQRDTALGATAGGLAGAALGGGALGTIGGAAAGGLIGNQVGK